jgi:hypothetical protein
MTISSTTAPTPVQTTGQGLRILLVTAAILVLISVAFVIGRVTVSSSRAPAKAPAASTMMPVSNDGGSCQQVGHLQSAGC